MRIAYTFAAVVAISPAAAFALTIDDFTVTGAVTDIDNTVSGPQFIRGQLTQALSPLVQRTMTYEDNYTVGGGSIVSFNGELRFADIGSGAEFASVTYDFATMLDVSGGGTGFSFGTGSVDNDNVLEATLKVTDTFGASASSGPINITGTPASLDFAYASLAGIKLSSIKSITLELQNTSFGTDGVIASAFTADGGTITPVPLPAGLPLLLAGLGGFAVLRRFAA